MGHWIARGEHLVATAQGRDRSLAGLRLTDWLGRAWRSTEAEAVLDAAAQVLGADHHSTLAARNNLALAYRSEGRLAEAIDVHERTLTDRVSAPRW
ncbi:MAG: tetratricopeptide repeat protein [Actinomycetota bacterium]|nr:tetratricopeptide repeat protein [Actinomycetota bacterium]